MAAARQLKVKNNRITSSRDEGRHSQGLEQCSKWLDQCSHDLEEAQGLQPVFTWSGVNARVTNMV